MKMIIHVQLYSFSQTTIMINTLLVLFVNLKKSIASNWCIYVIVLTSWSVEDT